MSKHTIDELREKLALPLDIKIRMTKARIRDWINEFGEDGVYVSFSGGKDSTVLLDLVRQDYPDAKAVFVDTGLEYPEIREFVKKFDNVDWLKPKKTFKQVINDYGYPFISKEVSERVYYAQRYLRWYAEKDGQTKDIPSPYGIMDLAGVKRGGETWREGQRTKLVPEEILEKFAVSGEKGSFKISQLTGKMTKADGKPTQFDYRKWIWLASCPWMISNKCCNVMKKSPVHSYAKRTGRKPMTAQMACESRLRTQQWMKNGCNGFDMKSPVSNPMSFWNEQDVLKYIYKNHIQIASVYGEVVKENEVEGQLDFEDIGFCECDAIYRTTGCKRTGCMFCGYGCHLEKEGEGRFEIMKTTHPKQYDYIMRSAESGGLNYKEVIDWLNSHGNLNIRY